MRFARTMVAVFSRIYAETTVKVAIINVPWALRWALNLVLEVLPARTRARVHVLGSHFAGVLAADLDETALSLLVAPDRQALARHRGRRLPIPRGAAEAATLDPTTAATAHELPPPAAGSEVGQAARQAPGPEGAVGAPRPCPECLASGTEPPSNWADVSGSWVVERAEGDVDGVLGRVGYGPMARGAFRIGNYGAGVARIDITMHSPRRITLIFGGGPMPATTNVLDIDGTVQPFVGNEGIPGDDRYQIAMWWEEDCMVAWGEHDSGRFPRMDTRRYLRRRDDGGNGGSQPHGELVVERTVEGVFSRMVYRRVS